MNKSSKTFEEASGYTKEEFENLPLKERGDILDRAIYDHIEDSQKRIKTGFKLLGGITIAFTLAMAAIVHTENKDNYAPSPVTTETPKSIFSQ